MRNKIEQEKQTDCTILYEVVFNRQTISKYIAGTVISPYNFIQKNCQMIVSWKPGESFVQMMDPII